MSAAGRVLFPAAAVFALAVAELSATERLERRFDTRDGLPAAEVSALAQDSAGFIWIGTYGGLVRYDGAELRLWGRDTLNTEVRFIADGPDRELIVGDGDRLLRVVADGLEPVTDASGRPSTGIVQAAYDDGGRLWVVRGQKILWRNGGSWEPFDVPLLETESVRQLRRGADRTLYVLTDAAVWQISSAPNAKRLFPVARPRQLVIAPDGAIVTFATTQGAVVAYRGGRIETLFHYMGRPIALARRANTIWVAWDSGLAALRPGEPPEVIGVQHGLISGGPLLVDREGGLWLGTFRGLVYYPEPDVRIWTEADGVSGRAVFFLARTRETLWVTGFRGVSRLEGLAQRVTYAANVHGPLCPDERDRLWIRGTSGFVSLVEYRDSQPVAATGCTRTLDGALWVMTGDQLFRKAAGASTFHPIDNVPGGMVGAILRGDSLGRLWLGRHERVCHALTVALTTNGPPAWSCQQVDGVRDVYDFHEVQPDRLWMATRMGVLRRDPATNVWAQIPGSRSLPSSIVTRLAPSASGGVWVVGEGGPLRVVDRPESVHGWEVVERLSAWQGVPSAGSRDIHEDPAGALWVATLAGIVRIPAAVRKTALPAPLVELVALAIDGHAPPSAGSPSRLRHKSNLIELRFAALSYRARGLLRYQVRHRPDAPWTDLNETPPTLRYVNLPYGRYDVQLRASLDGRNWSAAPAAFAFEILRPWYFKAWAIALLASIAAAALYLAYRVRVAFLLRMERQRVRIAMDLHDEVGSGLGSIGLLASLAADDRLDEERRRTIANEIADMAGDVGATLGDLVWALRVRGETLESLAYYLVERAGRLFPDAQPQFVTDFPDPWPSVRLSAAVRQNVLMIALEALHNAARHARAKRVILSFKPVGGEWRLSVTDDGVGLSGDRQRTDSQGTGMFSMRTRAEAIGAKITFSANRATGTIVQLTFDPQARERTPSSRPVAASL